MEIEREHIVQFIREQGNYSGELDDGAKLFSTGLLDSFLMVELILHLETLSGARVPPDAITLDNFDEIGAILAYIKGLKE